jgi:hypothetical protein
MRKVCKLPDCYPVSNDIDEDTIENFRGTMPSGVTSTIDCDNTKAWLQRWDNNMSDLCYYNTGGDPKDAAGNCPLASIDIGTFASRSGDAGGVAGMASKPCWTVGVPKTSTAPCPTNYVEIPAINPITNVTNAPSLAGMCLDGRPTVTSTAVCDRSKGWINRFDATQEDTCYLGDGGHPFSPGTSTCPAVTKNMGIYAPCDKTPCFIQGLPKSPAGTCPAGWVPATDWTPASNFIGMCVKAGSSTDLKPGGACAATPSPTNRASSTYAPIPTSSTAPSQWIPGVDNMIVMGGAAALVVILIVMMK